MCHGLFGNAASLLVAGRALGDPSLREAAEERAAAEVAKQPETGARWRSGNRDAAPTPGLLLGDSGVGLFFLQLASPDCPSPLLPANHVPPAPLLDGEAVYPESVRLGMLRHFPRTRSVLERAGAGLSRLDFAGDPTVPLRSLIAATLAPAAAAKAGEALWLEHQAFTLLCGQVNFADSYCRSLMRRSPEILADPETRIRLAPGARLFQAQHDWEAMLTPGATVEDVPASPTAYVIFESGLACGIKRLPPVAAALCASVQEPKRVREAVEATVEQMVAGGMLSSPHGPEAASVRESVSEAIRKAYVAEIVDVVEPEITPQDVVGELCTRCGECCRIKVYIPGDEAYAQFLKEVLEEPLRSAYPEAAVRFGGEAGEGQVLLDLGYCRHLRREGSPEGERFFCGIYAERPEICRSFNCVSWWQLQRVRSSGATASDRLIRRVVALKSREP